jgi:hypothetical protein
VLSRSAAVDVKSGKPRLNITNIADIKTDWLSGARNVQIKQPIAVEDGVPLRVDRKAGFSFHHFIYRCSFKEYLTTVQIVSIKRSRYAASLLVQYKITSRSNFA